jgi:hypothetical protein
MRNTTGISDAQAAAYTLLIATGDLGEAMRELVGMARQAGFPVDYQDGSWSRRRIGIGPLLSAAPGASAKHLRLHRIAERDGGWQCWHCGVELVDYCHAEMNTDSSRCVYLTAGSGRQFAAEDHLVPKQFRGSDVLDNLVLSCSPCNSRKGAA